FASGTAVPLPACLDAMLELVAEDADALGCVAEIESARTIIAEGTSADRQLAVYGDAPQRGLNNGAALAAVVDWLAEATAGPGA
ncbi:MAG: carboxylate-amine ligase, partial [Acetobacteraceae bacterium]|nr:carboxylate-amine ligase [Acetobacteraceae bacterium]